ncbi:hypothetical protein [Ralstonia pseudosolanacearum]|uniref:hypothetical protein n=1 Tax=Ralstonia pseudosolanacearum TaxID=1310165 RepID=UPI0013F4C1C2|nr:hypothetical protein [Ralstonia pseudosolanacearum]QIK19565.1 hypothetical protein G7968_14805 [Ralstonia solanacearum]
MRALDVPALPPGEPHRSGPRCPGLFPVTMPEAVPVGHGPQNQIVPMAGAIRRHENAGSAIHATERIPSCRPVVTRMWRLPLFMEPDHAHRLA